MALEAVADCTNQMGMPKFGVQLELMCVTLNAVFSLHFQTSYGNGSPICQPSFVYLIPEKKEKKKKSILL